MENKRKLEIQRIYLETKNLIDVVESDKDFHAINVERFFGIPYNQIVSENGEVLNKDIRETLQESQPWK